MGGGLKHILPRLPAQTVPCSLDESETVVRHEVVGHRLHGVVVHPRTARHRKALLFEVSDGGPILASLLHIAVGILPVADYKITRKAIHDRRGFLRAEFHKVLPLRIGFIKKHIMPHHRASSAGFYKIGKPVEMSEELLRVRAFNAKGAFLCAECLIASDMEIRRISEIFMHLGDNFAQNALRLGIHNTPHPSVRLEERLVVRIYIER